MNRNPLISIKDIVYESILLFLYCIVSILSYVFLHRDLITTMNLIAIGAALNLFVFVISVMPIKGKLTKEERQSLDMNSSGVMMTRKIFRFFITGLNTMMTIFFMAIVIASASGRFI